jgi:hypothetical protein
MYVNYEDFEFIPVETEEAALTNMRKGDNDNKFVGEAYIN